MLERVCSQAGDWQRRDGDFYQCLLRDVTAAVPEDFRLALVDRVRVITGLPLVERVDITAQRMIPGQSIGVHSDRPLLGYEIARLVVQLTRQWQPADGGVLELFDQPAGPPVYSVNPGYNEAFGFILHEDSHHAVTEVTRQRSTVVFNFWHAANTPELARAIQSLFVDIHFSALPVALNPVASAAESSLPEDLTFRASMAALALLRWGYDEEAIITGYRHSTGMLTDDILGPEVSAAVRLADWVARLYQDPFDLRRWETLQNELGKQRAHTRLLPIWNLCLPGMYGQR